MGTPLVLGADLSTDKIEFVVVNTETGALEAGGNFKFLDHLADRYGLKAGGFLELMDGTDAIVRVPYGLLPDALDLMLMDVRRQLGGALANLQAICVSLQQHGVGAYNESADARLTELGTHPTRALSDGIDGLFTTPGATSWIDSSSLPDAEELEQQRSPDFWADLTGSSPMQSLRFLLPQVCYLHRKHRDQYESTVEFNVLASIVAGMLVGRRVGIGLDEASCTLLMNIHRGKWATNLLRGVLPPRGLFGRLARILRPGEDLGRIWSYWVNRHNIPESCKVFLGLGDNIAILLTLFGYGLSLGSSGTTFSEFAKATFDRTHSCHVLRSAAERFMGMFSTNQCGKFADKVRQLIDVNWDQFHDLVANPPWDNPQAIVLPTAGVPQFLNVEPGSRVSAAAVTRSILMNMKLRSAFMGSPPSIIGTGGFAKPDVGQMIADIFRTPTYLSPEINRVAWGSAVMAMARLQNRPLDEVAKILCPTGQRINPDPSRAEFYRQFAEAFVRTDAKF
jgi:sugar (pentulose or hexulose) kinase